MLGVRLRNRHLKSWVVWGAIFAELNIIFSIVAFADPHIIHPPVINDLSALQYPNILLGLPAMGITPLFSWLSPTACAPSISDCMYPVNVFIFLFVFLTFYWFVTGVGIGLVVHKLLARWFPLRRLLRA